MAKSCQDLSLLPFYCAFLFILILPADALLHRTPGPANDARFSVPAAACNASSPYMWQFGNCSQLISCMFNNLNDTALSESLSIGTSIAALTPTILALIGESNVILLFKETVIQIPSVSECLIANFDYRLTATRTRAAWSVITSPCSCNLLL
jgi:hypothetical protein